MRVIAITNQKGGSGKTTTTVNLAAALGEKRRKVLVVDLDPQASASQWFGQGEESRDLMDVFVENTPISEIVRKTPVRNIDIVPSSTWLFGLEKALASEVGAETILQRQLSKLPADRWDYILMDCPPALGLLTVSALTAGNELIVPVEAHVMALSGLTKLLQTVDVVRDRLNPGLELAGILACRVDARTRHCQEVVEQLRTRFGSIVYNTPICENVRIAEAPSFFQPITAYAPQSKGAHDFVALAREVIKQERKKSYGKAS